MKNTTTKYGVLGCKWIFRLVITVVFLYSFQSIKAQCTAPIATASPASQTICSGSAPSIILQSDIVGTTFALTVVQTGVTGAFGGSFTTIQDTLYATGSSTGTAVYTIYPTYNGCMGNAITVTITVEPQADASFAYSSATFCQTGTDPTPQVTGMQGGIFSSIPSGLTINTSTGLISLATSVLGTYTVTYTTNGTCPNASSVNITITNAPSANFSYTGSPYCQSVNGPFPTFGSGASAGTFSAAPSGLNFVHVNSGQIDLMTSTPGTYTVTNTIPANGGCAAAIATGTVTITSLEDAAFVYSSATYCQTGTDPTPQITGVQGGVFSSTPAGLTINASTGLISLATSALGNYTVTYTTSGTCPNTSSVNTTIATAPSANFSYSYAAYCQNASNPSPVFGSGASAGTFSSTPLGLAIANVNTGEIAISLSIAGTYTITNTIPANGGCAAAIATTTVIIIAFDDAAFVYSSPIYCQTETNPTPTITGVSGGFFSSIQTGLSIDSLTGTINISTSALGTFTVSYTTNSTCPNTSYLNITITNAVWPGDANHDSLVNNNDLLTVGLFYGQSWLARATISNVWQAHSSANWGILESNGADIKNADCNGDGTIDANDTLAINLNFSLTHLLPAIPNYNNERLTAPEIYFSVVGVSYNAGDWVEAALWLGSSTNPVNNLYGIAFNINYTSSLVQSGTENIVYTDSWLGTPGTDVIKISKADAFANVAYGAETRIDHTNANGFGKIADFKFQVNTSLNSVADINLSISNYLAVDNTGATIVLNPQPTLIYVVGIDEQNNNSEITIAPNPFNNQTIISFNEEQKHSTLKITDVLGKEVRSINFSGKQLIIEKGEMQPGIYFVKIYDGKKIYDKKIVVQ